MAKPTMKVNVLIQNEAAIHVFVEKITRTNHLPRTNTASESAATLISIMEKILQTDAFLFTLKLMHAVQSAGDVPTTKPLLFLTNHVQHLMKTLF